MNTNLIPKRLALPIAKSISIQTYQSPHINNSIKPLICFHGWLDNSASFFRLAEQFPDLPWCIIDLIGHGHSSHRPEGSFYYFWDYLCDAASLIQTHFPQGAHLLGHSLGSGIALLTAGLLPKLTHSVALIDGLGPLVSQPELINQEFRFSMQQYHHPQHPKRSYTSIQAMAVARQKRHQIELASCLLLAEYGHIKKGDDFTWAFDPRLLILPPFQMIEEQVVAMIKTIKQPVLLLQAQSGFKVDPSFFAQRQKALQHVLQHHIVPGHHHVHLDSPQTVSPYLAKFWQQVGLL